MNLEFRTSLTNKFQKMSLTELVKNAVQLLNKNDNKIDSDNLETPLNEEEVTIPVTRPNVIISKRHSQMNPAKLLKEDNQGLIPSRNENLLDKGIQVDSSNGRSGGVGGGGGTQNSIYLETAKTLKALN